MTELDSWLKQATRHLSKESVAQVRTEIREHYESAREAAMSGGATYRSGDFTHDPERFQHFGKSPYTFFQSVRAINSSRISCNR
jgi:general stress protein YciG